MYNVICAIAKNENNYINDWIKWHIDLGFDHIYIFDNNDKTTPYVGDYIDAAYKSKVTFFDKRGIHEHAMQLKYYNDFYQEYNEEFDWCAFIDIDEFINLRDWKTIPEFLNDSRFKNYDIIRLKWHLYGDDDLIFRDMSKPVYEVFKKQLITGPSCINHGKHLIRGHMGNHVDVCSCHYSYIDKEVKGSCLPSGNETHSLIYISEKYTDEAWINHYMTKSLSEFALQKYSRGDAVFNKRKIDWDYFWKINKRNNDKLAYIKCVENTLPIWYYNKFNNAGDIFSDFLYQQLGLHPHLENKDNAILFGAGSILQQVSNKNTYVFGSGLHNAEYGTKVDKDKIIAVRGKLTAEKLNSLTITVGDPGLLLSYVYRPHSIKRYKYGIITHFIDYDDLKIYATPECPVINMRLNENSSTAISDLIEKINQCEFIFSSSLHGVIFAHSLGIPAIHIENKPLMSKNNFKFKDYYSVFETVHYQKVIYSSNFNFEDMYNKLKTTELKPDYSEVYKIQRQLIKAFMQFIKLYDQNVQTQPLNNCNKKTKFRSFIDMMQSMEENNKD